MNVPVRNYLGTYFFGLTDDLDAVQKRLGSPASFRGFWFTSPDAAHDWERGRLARGFVRVPGNDGWHYGYYYHDPTAIPEEQPAVAEVPAA